MASGPPIGPKFWVSLGILLWTLLGNHGQPPIRPKGWEKEAWMGEPTHGMSDFFRQCDMTRRESLQNDLGVCDTLHPLQSPQTIIASTLIPTLRIPASRIAHLTKRYKIVKNCQNGPKSPKSPKITKKNAQSALKWPKKSGENSSKQQNGLK